MQWFVQEPQIGQGRGCGEVEWRRWENFCGKEGERVKMVEIFVEIAAIFVALFGTIHIMNG